MYRDAPLLFYLPHFPKLREVLDPAFVVPDALAELSAALWLAIKGVKLPVRAKETSSELVI